MKFPTLILLLAFTLPAFGQTDYIEESGGVITFNADGNGYKIPDFSHAGYKNSDEDLPVFGVEYTAGATINTPSGDETARIQAAIDTVEALSLNGFGFRGAVVLGAGTWNFSSELSIEASGVGIRGAGRDSTILQFTGGFVNTGFRLGHDSRYAKVTIGRRICCRRVTSGA